MFLDNYKVTFEAPTAAGTTTIDSAAYDMKNFESILFIVRLGTPAANNNIRVQQDTASNMAAAADLAGTLVNSPTLNQHMVFIARPREQFVRCRVTRGTSTTIDGIVVLQVNPRNRPIVQPTSVFEEYSAPAEGAA